LVPAGGIEPTA